MVGACDEGGLSVSDDSTARVGPFGAALYLKLNELHADRPNVIARLSNRMQQWMLDSLYLL